MSRKILFFILSAGLLWVAGCAPGPRLAERFPYTTISINNAAYFALVDLCDREGIKWDYDPLSKVIILKPQDKEVKLLIGSQKIIEGGNFHELSAPIELKDSVIYAPVDLRDYLQGLICKLPGKNLLVGPAYLRSVDFVVIDAGHGGKDSGATGRYGLKEKGVVLDVAQKIKEDLEHCGLKVVLSRPDDEFIPLPERSRIANEKKADLFVSIHANANHSRWIEGLEVYYLTEAVDDNARAQVSAENAPLEIEGQDLRNQPRSLKATLWDMVYTENRKEGVELAQCISRSVCRKMNLKNLGVKGAPFAVLKGAQMPAVLVEIGYISNREGEKKLRDPEYRRKMAEAIAEGIFDFKNYAEGKI